MWPKSFHEGPVALIAGEGAFPLEMARACASSGHPLVAIGLEGFMDRRIEDFASEIVYVPLGEIEPIFAFLRKKAIKRVVLAGAVPKKRLVDPAFKVDGAAKGLLQATRNKGDDHLLRAFGLLLKARCGASVVDPRDLLPQAVAKKGKLTRRGPTEREHLDLKLGYEVAKHVGKMDIGQTIVIKDGIVLAVEALEGTDETIRRAGTLGGEAVVVKVSKPRQDLRFDLPCVGMKTLDSLKAASSQVLGVEAGKTLLIGSEKLLQAADDNGITIVGL